MVSGPSGLNGQFVVENVMVVYNLFDENAVIPHREIAADIVLVSERNIVFAIPK